MTDITKYANISLSLATYNKIKEQSEKLCGVKISCSQTVTHAINLVEECMATGLIPTAFQNLEPEAKKHRFASILQKFKLISGGKNLEKTPTYKYLNNKHDTNNRA